MQGPLGRSLPTGARKLGSVANRSILSPRDPIRSITTSRTAAGRRKWRENNRRTKVERKEIPKRKENCAGEKYTKKKKKEKEEEKKTTTTNRRRKAPFGETQVKAKWCKIAVWQPLTTLFSPARLRRRVARKPYGGGMVRNGMELEFSPQNSSTDQRQHGDAFPETLVPRSPHYLHRGSSGMNTKRNERWHCSTTTFGRKARTPIGIEASRRCARTRIYLAPDVVCQLCLSFLFSM